MLLADAITFWQGFFVLPIFGLLIYLIARPATPDAYSPPRRVYVQEHATA